MYTVSFSHSFFVSLWLTFPISLLRQHLSHPLFICYLFLSFVNPSLSGFLTLYVAFILSFLRQSLSLALSLLFQPLWCSLPLFSSSVSLALCFSLSLIPQSFSPVSSFSFSPPPSCLSCHDYPCGSACGKSRVTYTCPAFANPELIHLACSHLSIYFVYLVKQ